MYLRRLKLLTLFDSLHSINIKIWWQASFYNGYNSYSYVVYIMSLMHTLMRYLKCPEIGMLISHTLCNWYHCWTCYIPTHPAILRIARKHLLYFTVFEAEKEKVMYKNIFCGWLRFFGKSNRFSDLKNNHNDKLFYKLYYVKKSNRFIKYGNIIQPINK